MIFSSLNFMTTDNKVGNFSITIHKVCIYITINYSYFLIHLTMNVTLNLPLLRP